MPMACPAHMHVNDARNWVELKRKQVACHRRQTKAAADVNIAFKMSDFLIKVAFDCPDVVQLLAPTQLPSSSP